MTDESCLKELDINDTKPMVHILQKIQQTLRTVVSLNAIRKESHSLDFHGRAATHDALITKSNHSARLRWSKDLHNWTANQWKQVLLSDESNTNKTRLVGRRCTLNLSRAQTFSRWCDVVVKRRSASSGVIHTTYPWFKITWFVAKCLRAAKQYDVNILSLTLSSDYLPIHSNDSVIQ
ncbi:uncharacterized protein TNCV_2538711 [Trichonephila clavipes]|nr:uncharacterized protein TNCV_2538711 [Trichonephila clavipes]